MTTQKKNSSILSQFYQGDYSPYKTYSSYLKSKFGEKVYKIPIHLQGSCPNRDGTCGTGGCIFCGEEGGSFEWESYGSVSKQIAQNREKMAHRYKAKSFIAYFQNFTNTYLPLEDFKKNLEEARMNGIVGINIATRPDCIGEDYIELLSQYQKDYLITVELGLQSVNNNTLKKINRGHDIATFIDAVKRIKKRNIRVSVHLILDLPWDSMEDILSSAYLMNQCGVDEVKIHNLYIVKGSKLARMYEDKEFFPLSMDDFIERCIVFLEHLDPNIVIGRLTGRAPQSEVVVANWNHSWYYVRDEIIRRMMISDRFQGSKLTN